MSLKKLRKCQSCTGYAQIMELLFFTLVHLCFFFPLSTFLYLVIIQGVHVADNLHQILWINVAHPFLCLERGEIVIVIVQTKREFCKKKSKLGEHLGNFIFLERGAFISVPNWSCSLLNWVFFY